MLLSCGQRVHIKEQGQKNTRIHAIKVQNIHAFLLGMKKIMFFPITKLLVNEQKSIIHNFVQKHTAMTVLQPKLKQLCKMYVQKI